MLCSPEAEFITIRWSLIIHIWSIKLICHILITWLLTITIIIVVHVSSHIVHSHSHIHAHVCRKTLIHAHIHSSSHHTLIELLLLLSTKLIVTHSHISLVVLREHVCTHLHSWHRVSHKCWRSCICLHTHSHTWVIKTLSKHIWLECLWFGLLLQLLLLLNLLGLIRCGNLTWLSLSYTWIKGLESVHLILLLNMVYSCWRNKWLVKIKEGINCLILYNRFWLLLLLLLKLVKIVKETTSLYRYVIILYIDCSLILIGCWSRLLRLWLSCRWLITEKEIVEKAALILRSVIRRVCCCRWWICWRLYWNIHIADKLH